MRNTSTGILSIALMLLMPLQLNAVSTGVVLQHFKSPAYNFEFDYLDGWGVQQIMQTSIFENIINVSPSKQTFYVSLIQRKLKQDVTQEDLESEFDAHTQGVERGVSRRPYIDGNLQILSKSISQNQSEIELISVYEGETGIGATSTTVHYRSIGRGRYIYTFKYWIVHGYPTEGYPEVDEEELSAIVSSVVFTDDQPKQPWLPEQSFTDVRVDHPYFGSTSYMKQHEWVEGYADGSYKPENPINRAEFTKILINTVFNIDPAYQPDTCIEKQANGQNLFVDVELNSWFSGPICTAKAMGLIQGYPDGMFHPERDIAFAEAAKIVALAFRADQQTDEVWFRPYVNYLAGKKAIPPSIASFDSKLTRGEMAELIYRMRTGAQGNSLTYDQLQ